MPLKYANNFQDLVVYQKARELAKQIHSLSSTFPREEIYSLTSQIRRSSSSIGAQIAEAWAKRRYEKHFIAKLSDADGEQMETQHWLESSVDFGYLSREKIQPLLASCIEIGRLLGSMMIKASLFCKPESLAIHEEQAEYLITPDD